MKHINHFIFSMFNFFNPKFILVLSFIFYIFHSIQSISVFCSLTNWTPKLGSREFVEKELARAFASWSPYAKIKFVPVDDYHSADIRILFGRYNHGD